MATESDSKKLSDLRVVHLRAELEKRDLDKTGVKVNLIERLQKALVQEGKDPEEYEFDLSDKKPSKRLSSARMIEKDLNEDQSANDSSVLMIETPSLDTGLDMAQESEREEKEIDIKVDNENTESPLNLSIGEEEEILLMASADEQENSRTEEMKEIVDDGNLAELENVIKEEENNTDAVVEKEQVMNRDEIMVEESRSDSSKNEDSLLTTDEVSSNITSAVPFATTNTDLSEKIEKDEDKNLKSNPGRSLWVTNIVPSTRAQELKHLLSQYGKVIGAKVVQSSRHPSQRCYGYVTMETRVAADLCIEKLNNTKLEGQVIRIAKVRPEHSLPMSTEKEKYKKKEGSPEKNGSDKSRERKKVSSVVYKKKEESKKESKTEERVSKNTSRSVKKNRSVLKSSIDRKSDILRLNKSREERERKRDHERAIHKEKKRREMERAREIEKRQREESIRLDREREKLRIERERLDRQRAEIMRLERERQRLEREKLEQEKQELRRQQIRLEEARRPVKRLPSTTTASFRREDDRKRVATERHYDDTPPPPRFEVTTREPEIAIKKEIPKLRITYPKRQEEYSKRGNDLKREYPSTERHSGGHSSHILRSINNNSKYDSSTYVNRERERDIPLPRVSKDARHEERSPVSYRPVRDERERRQVGEHHLKGTCRDHRYAEAALKEGARYRENNSWHSVGGIGDFTSSSRESWNKSDNWAPMETRSNDMWGNGSSRLILSNSPDIANVIYSDGNSNMSGIGLTCPTSPGISNYSLDRFETYNSINNLRKY